MAPKERNSKHRQDTKKPSQVHLEPEAEQPLEQTTRQTVSADTPRSAGLQNPSQLPPSSEASIGHGSEYEHRARPAQPPAEIADSSLAQRNPPAAAVPRGFRSSDAPQPLPPFLTKFFQFGPTQFANCADFCRNHPEIWTEDPGSLQHLAKEFLRRDERIAAERAIQRLLMLSWVWEDPRGPKPKEQKLDLLAKLYRSRPLQARLAQNVRGTLETLTQMVAEEARAEREPKSQKGDDVPAEDNDDNQDVEEEGAEEDDGFETSTAASTSRNVRNSQAAAVAAKPRRQHAAHRSTFAASSPATSVQGNTGQSTTSSLPSRTINPALSDFDSLSQPGGPSLPGPRRSMGPLTELGENLQGAQLERYNAVMQHFVVHKGKLEIQVFKPGSLIAVLWHENYGSSLKNAPAKVQALLNMPTSQRSGPGFLTRIKNGELVYSHIKRFVVVNQRQGFSITIPISSYSGNGLSRKHASMLDKEIMAHAIVYAKGKQPVLMEGEPEFAKESICIDITAPDETLSRSSRLYYAKPQSIDHNIKVKHLGQVIPDHLRILLLAYQTEHQLQPLKYRRNNTGHDNLTGL